MVPENRRLFHNMTVAENLELGAYLRRDRAKIAEDREKAFGNYQDLSKALDAKPKAQPSPRRSTG